MSKVSVSVRIQLYVFHAEDKEIVWRTESWLGSMPDVGQYDPLMLQREDGVSPDAHQLFKLENIVPFGNKKTCTYGRVPVARDGWFYKALPNWGFKQIGD